MPAIRSRSRARYDAEGADELAFLDIRASIETRGLLYDMIEAVADVVFIPLTVGGGVNSIDDIRALLNAGADKVSINTAGVANPAPVRRGVRALRRAVHRRGDRREAGGAGAVACLHARRPHADRASMPWSGRARSSLAAPAKSCSPAWIATACARASTSR